MAKAIHHRLAEQIQAAGETGLVEAVIVVQGTDDPALAGEDGGLMQRVVASAAFRSGDQPRRVRYFPRANAAVVQGSVRLIQALLQDENLVVASAVDFEPFL